MTVDPREPSTIESLTQQLESKEALPIDAAAGQQPPPATNAKSVQHETRFVRTVDDQCDLSWASWPAMNEAALANGTLLMFDLFPSVGNVLMVLGYVVQVNISVGRSIPVVVCDSSIT